MLTIVPKQKKVFCVFPVTPSHLLIVSMLGVTGGFLSCHIPVTYSGSLYWNNVINSSKSSMSGIKSQRFEVLSKNCHIPAINSNLRKSLLDQPIYFLDTDWFNVFNGFRFANTVGNHLVKAQHLVIRCVCLLKFQGLFIGQPIAHILLSKLIHKLGIELIILNGSKKRNL